jgi:ankyrin repeat protein
MAGRQPKRKPRAGVDQYGRTPLHGAAADSRPDEVAKLLAEGADVNAQDDNGWTPLHFAAQVVSPEITAQLLRVGANPALQDAYGNTALWKAVFASKGDGCVIALLRQAGADPLKKNNHGVSPVSLARTIANYDVAQFFNDVMEPPDAG